MALGSIAGDSGISYLGRSAAAITGDTIWEQSGAGWRDDSTGHSNWCNTPGQPPIS